MIAEVYSIDGIESVSLSVDVYNKKYNLFEDNSTIHNFVKDVVNFNISKTNTNINDIDVEFYFKILSENKVSFVQHNNQFPLISSMTILEYYNSNISCEAKCDEYNLNVFTNIDFKTYKYKKYRKHESGKKIVTTITKKNKHIIYNGENANIYINKNNTSPIILFINIWDKNVALDNKNIFIESVDTKITFNNITFNEEPNHEIELKNQLNDVFFENILYKHNNDCLKFILMILQEHKYKNIKITDIYDIKKEETDRLKNKYGDVINDIQDINKSPMKQNRFYQRFQTKMFSNETCNWLINETEEYVKKNGWDTDNFKNYPTYDLNLSKITGFHDYFLKHELGRIMKYIEKSYCLPNETKFEISDLNIIKYSNELQTHLDHHTDISFLSFNIALNHLTDYEGGGTYFDDGLIMNIDKGDMLVHCGKIMHSGLTITRGVRYILVGFINIIYEA